MAILDDYRTVLVRRLVVPVMLGSEVLYLGLLSRRWLSTDFRSGDFSQSERA